MKALFRSLLLAVLLLTTACHSSEESQPATGEATINFYVMNYEQTSMDKVRTRATEAISLAHLSVAVYDATTLQPVGEAQTQDKDQEQYGEFSLTLPYGQYVLVFLGYDGSRTALMQDAHAICFADDYVPNLFLKTLTLTLSPDSPTTHSVTLSRAVACFTLTCDGELPSTLATMRFTAQGGGGTLDALTGYTSTVQERTYTYQNLSSYAGKTSMNVNLYTFLPSDEATMSFTVTAYDTEGNSLRSRTFTDVPMKINQRTRYTGDFFASEGFSLLLDNDVWDEQSFTF